MKDTLTNIYIICICSLLSSPYAVAIDASSLSLYKSITLWTNQEIPILTAFACTSISDSIIVYTNFQHGVLVKTNTATGEIIGVYEPDHSDIYRTLVNDRKDIDGRGYTTLTLDEAAYYPQLQTDGDTVPAFYKAKYYIPLKSNDEIIEVAGEFHLPCIREDDETPKWTRVSAVFYVDVRTMRVVRTVAIWPSGYAYPQPCAFGLVDNRWCVVVRIQHHENAKAADYELWQYDTLGQKVGIPIKIENYKQDSMELPPMFTRIACLQDSIGIISGQPSKSLYWWTSSQNKMWRMPLLKCIAPYDLKESNNVIFSPSIVGTNGICSFEVTSRDGNLAHFAIVQYVIRDSTGPQCTRIMQFPNDYRISARLLLKATEEEGMAYMYLDIAGNTKIGWFK